MSYRDATLEDRIDMMLGEKDFCLADYLMRRVDEGKENKEDEKIIRTISLLQKRFQQAQNPEDMLALSGYLSIAYAAYRTDNKAKKAHWYKIAKQIG